MRRSAIIILTFFLIGGCIDPLKVTDSSLTPTLVVDGLITDQAGPYTVKLYNALPINDPLDQAPPVDGATVTIADDQGSSEILKQTDHGVYQTSLTQGIIGRTYTLTITTADGITYNSSAETMLPVGDFTDLHYEFISPSDPGDVFELNTTNGFNIFASATVLPEQTGFVRFRWTGTFEIATYPQFHIKILTNRATGEEFPAPDPLPCSGYIVKGGTLQQTGPCTCCICWVTQYNDTPLISDPNFVTNGEITKYKIDFIAANRRYLYDKYYLSVDMLSASPSVYEFWKRVASQRQQSGDLFQTTPGLTGGNIMPTSPGQPPVVGVFSAAAIRTKAIIVTPDEVPYAFRAIDTIANSCNSVYTNSSFIKPSFW